MNKRIQAFKEHRIKAKKLFAIKRLQRPEAHAFISQYHYLGDTKSLSYIHYGLYIGRELVGVIGYGKPLGHQTAKAWTNSTERVLELIRVALHPSLNGTNALSYFIGASIRDLKKLNVVDLIISLAEASRHVGSAYQVCNFKYYGLTSPKQDFFLEETGAIQQRGKTKGVKGCWVKRARKHRYAYHVTKGIEINYERQPYPQKNEVYPLDCCNNREIVHDSRTSTDYTCPYHTGSLTKL